MGLTYVIWEHSTNSLFRSPPYLPPSLSVWLWLTGFGVLCVTDPLSLGRMPYTVPWKSICLLSDFLYFWRHGSHYPWRKPAFHSKSLIPMVNHGGGSVMVWGCFAASRPGRLSLIEGTMNSALYQRILQQNVGPSVCELKLKHSWVMYEMSPVLQSTVRTSYQRSSMVVVVWWLADVNVSVVKCLCF